MFGLIKRSGLPLQTKDPSFTAQSPGVVRVRQSKVTGVVAEVPDPVGDAGKPDAALQELPGRHTGPVAAALAWPRLLLPWQEVERADEPLRLRRREGGEAEENQEA